MKTNFKMKEATNKEEAIISILDVIEENPLWLNKVTHPFYMWLKEITPRRRSYCLTNLLNSQNVIDLFVNMKQEYYNFKDNTQWNY